MSSIRLPDEILYIILGRLPVLDLIRFICVCKRWRSLITSPDFISTHLNLHENKDGYVLFGKSGGSEVLSIFHKNTFALHSKLEVPFSCETTKFSLAGCVNGLLCLTDCFHPFGRSIYLWNPSISKLKIIRDSCFAGGCSMIVLGFGFHNQTNDYKIVRIRKYVYREPPEVEVYSLARNSWRIIGTNARWYTTDQKYSTVVVSGAVHWFASKNVHASEDFVLKFDFGSEKFGEIMVPNYRRDGEFAQVCVAVLRESLALIVVCINLLSDEHRCEIWVMREYGIADSWTKQYSFATKEICYRCIGIFNNNVLLSGFGKLLSYDLEKSQFNQVMDREYLGVFTNFTESLALYNEGFCLIPRKHLLVEQ